MIMDSLAQMHYEMVFELEFRRKKGDEFQKFFGRIMNMKYPGDFVQTKPWGRLGDQKCDGYLPSLKRFYQCYGPDRFPRKGVALKKLIGDFDGALPYADEYFKTWVFTHNFEDGRLPTWLGLKLQHFREKHSPLMIEHLGIVELRALVFSLSNQDIVAILGPAPTQHAMMTLGLQDLMPILNHLEQTAVAGDDMPHVVSPDKLDYNALPPYVGGLLTAGMAKAALVQKYYKRTMYKEQGIKVASAFRNEYLRLKQSQLDSLHIFDGLHTYAGGPYFTGATAESSILAVLAYLFEECDIFEPPPEKTM
jgi:hypothetical protein